MFPGGFGGDVSGCVSSCVGNAQAFFYQRRSFGKLPSSSAMPDKLGCGLLVFISYCSSLSGFFIRAILRAWADIGFIRRRRIEQLAGARTNSISAYFDRACCPHSCPQGSFPVIGTTA
ncbi:hypothetical protein BN2476_230353 [Paraburkholderia piptadeniae]|uniref:Uncharacterized protein n=1 Tax=Paraburkholderia piptadeniae TaxID=1701573 RepID=A0A1N7RY21_9BURK|nr:hypothetical protein BN2476_230353 [Paraburkholderia piptadeniae]